MLHLGEAMVFFYLRSLAVAVVAATALVVVLVLVGGVTIDRSLGVAQGFDTVQGGCPAHCTE